MQRAVALRADGGGERMVVGLRVVADDLDLLLDEPIAGRRHEAGAFAEIFLAVVVYLWCQPVLTMTTSPRAHRLAGGLLEIVVGDRFPLLLRDRHHDAGAEEMRQRHFVDERACPATTCAGASMCVVLCMRVVMRCDSTPDFAM